MKKKILTLDDLYNFCVKSNYTKFSSEDTGYQISVQVPATFSLENENNESEYEDDTLMYGIVKMFHIGKNLNHSCVTEESAKKAMKTIPYKPILASFCEYTDENGNLIKDFTEHDAIIYEDDTIQYIERQVGCFTADEPWIEHDDELGVDFVYARCAIPRYYTDACEILERKNGTKVSVEFIINDMSYSNKDECLYLNDVIVQGETLLGINPNTKKEYKEGMAGSRLDIEKYTLKDFSTENNSCFNGKEDEETVEKFTELSEDEKCKEKDKCKEEETCKEEDKCKDEEKCKEEDKCKEKDAIEDVSDDDMEDKKEDMEDEMPEDDTEEPDDMNDDMDDDLKEDDKCKEKDVKESDVCKKEKEKCGEDKKECDKYTKTFKLSFDDIKTSLYKLLEKYEEIANDCYFITDVYDDYFVYQSWCDGEMKGQKYSKNENDEVSFEGDPYKLYVEYLTEKEKEEIDNMRKTYASISEELSKYKAKEDYEDKMTVFEDESYKGMLDTAEFKALMSQDSIEKYSKEELKDKADIAFAKIVKTKKTFTLEESSKEKETKKNTFAFGKRDERSSFLDGLLNKRD